MGNGDTIIVSSMRGNSRLRMRSPFSLSVFPACFSLDMAFGLSLFGFLFMPPRTYSSLHCGAKKRIPRLNSLLL